MSRPLVLAAAAAFALVALAPVAMMLGRMGASDLSGLMRPQSLDLLGRTLLLGGGAAAIAVLLGAPFGFLTARTDVPGAAVLRPLGILPLLLPPLFLAVAWTAMTEVRGAPAAIGVLGLNSFPIVALFTAKAFERVDARREEAALVSGGLRAVLWMEQRLALPGILCGACLAFVFAVNDFAVPNYVSSVGRKFNVYADEIFASWQQVQASGRAVAISLPLVALTLATLLPALALRRRGALTTLGGDFPAPGPASPGSLALAGLPVLRRVRRARRLGADRAAPVGGGRRHTRLHARVAARLDGARDRARAHLRRREPPVFRPRRDAVRADRAPCWATRSSAGAAAGSSSGSSRCRSRSPRSCSGSASSRSGTTT